ncbi:MAG: hypothetical protein U1E73_01570 [Planctomycetota bacterium]
MLANPIIVPVYADPITWGMALIAVLAEIVAAQVVLRRFGLTDPRFATPLFVVNVATWFPFLVAVDLLQLRYDAHAIPAYTVLELMVVVIEAFLIRSATRGQFFSSRFRCVPMDLKRSMMVSVVGNSVSVGVSLLLPLVLACLMR